jgi:hypothetical protein
MAEPHEEHADALEKDADFLEKNSDRVERMIKDTRADWESKKSSDGTPGAADPEDAAPGGLGDEDDA